MWSASPRALTGPPASTYAPAVEALRLYIDRVNAAGGVNGKQVKLILQDDSARAVEGRRQRQEVADAGQRGAAAQRQPVSTYAPMVAEAKRAGVPLLFAGSVCPKDVYPPAGSAAVLHDRLRRRPTTAAPRSPS